MYFMIIDIVLSIFFLLLLGITILNISRVINTDRELRALMYDSDIVQFFLSSSMLVFTALSIFILFFYSWELFLILLLISCLIETKIVVPSIEKVLGLVIEKIEKKISKKRKE